MRRAAVQTLQRGFGSQTIRPPPASSTSGLTYKKPVQICPERTCRCQKINIQVTIAAILALRNEPIRNTWQDGDHTSQKVTDGITDIDQNVQSLVVREATDDDGNERW